MREILICPRRKTIELSVKIVHDQGASNINCSSSFYDHDVILLVLLTICLNLASLTLQPLGVTGF